MRKGPPGTARKQQFAHRRLTLRCQDDRRENIKSILAGSNPSNRHLTEGGMIVPSDQERSRAVQPTLRSQPGSDVASLASEGLSMVSNGARHKIGAAVAHRAMSADKNAAAEAAPACTSQNPVVFIIDDDAAVRESLRSLLRSVGLQTEVFASAAELSAGNLPDTANCLVLDIRLPGMSGLDFQDQLARANIDIPIVFMSGYGDVAMAARAMKAGAVDFLTKPFREQDMLDAVAIAIERDRIRREHDKKASETHALFETLSPREREVMALVTSGLMNKQVAAKTGVAEATVKVHRAHVMRKMEAKSLADLVKMADIIGIHRDNSRDRRSTDVKAAPEVVIFPSAA